jgi:hypothetical protein
LATVAVSLRTVKGVRKVRVVYGSINTTPICCAEAEKALEKSEITQATVRQASESASMNVECLSDVLTCDELLKHNPNPSIPETEEAVGGLECRYGTYNQIREAVASVSKPTVKRETSKQLGKGVR